MAKQYRLGAGQRLANLLFTQLTKHGRGAGYRHILSVAGRTTGTLHSTPVDVMEVEGRRWLVAPYGEVNWVRNLRASAGHLTLQRGRRTETLGSEEVRGELTVPVLRTYMRSVPVTRQYWNVSADSSDAEIAADSVNHPVFRLGTAT